MKIIISDFDNTFYDDSYEKNIDEIKKFINDGNIFIIATGRNINQLKKDLDINNISCKFYICNDGATIYDNNLNLIYYKNIEIDIAKSIYEFLIKNNDICEVYSDSIDKYTDKIADRCNKIIAKPKNRKSAKLVLNELLNKYSSINGYISENWININDYNVSKGNAINFLINQYKLNKDSIYTIGDNINDISMMENFNSYAILNEPNIEYKSKYIVNNFIEFLYKVKSDS